MSSIRKNRCGNAMESIQALYKCLRDEVEQIEKVYLTCEKTERDLMQLHRDITYVLTETHMAQKMTGSLFEGLFGSLGTQASEIQDELENRLLLQVKELEEEYRVFPAEGPCACCGRETACKQLLSVRTKEGVEKKAYCPFCLEALIEETQKPRGRCYIGKYGELCWRKE